MSEWLSDKKNLFMYTLFLLGVFFGLMFWMVPAGSGKRQAAPALSASQSVVPADYPGADPAQR